MTDYTPHIPTTDYVRDQYVRQANYDFYTDEAIVDFNGYEVAAEFDRWLESVKAEERARIKLLFEKEVLETSKWQQWNRFNSPGSEWNGGNDSDTNYVIAMASHLLAILDDEDE